MFIAVYWWRVKPGMEDQFRYAWRRGTEAIKQTFHTFGSRLHLDSDGRFVGYAQWPDEQTWNKAQESGFDYHDPEAARLFRDAIAEAPPGDKPLLRMTVTDDLLTLIRAE